MAVHMNFGDYKNEIDLIDKILSIYSIAKFEEKTSEKNTSKVKSYRLKAYEKNILIYYIRKGITEQTLSDVCEDRQINKNYLHKINKDLRDKGYLVTSVTNLRKFHLNKDLEQIRKSFILDGLKNYLISFKKV